MSSHTQSTTAPLTFSAVYRVIPGAQAELSGFITEYVEAVRSAGTATHSLSAGLSEDGDSFAVTAVHADANAMEEHLIALAPFVERSFRLASVESITVVGSPGKGLSAALEANGAAGARVTVVQRGQGFANVGAPGR